MDETTAYLPGLSPVETKELCARFDGGRLSSDAPHRSRWRTATFETLRRAFLKIAVRIEELRSRVTIAFPSAYPYRKALISMAGSIAAQGP